MESSVLRKPDPTDVTDEEWGFVAPSLTLMTPDAPKRRHELREVFNALRWIVRAGAPWRLFPTNFPPWEAVYQQMQRWIATGCCPANDPHTSRHATYMCLFHQVDRHAGRAECLTAQISEWRVP